MINDSGGVRGNRRKSPTHTHTPGAGSKTTISYQSFPAFWQSSHRVVNKVWPAAFSITFMLWLIFTHHRRRSRLSRTLQRCAAPTTAASPRVLPPRPLRLSHTHIAAIPLLFVHLFCSPAATFAIRHRSIESRRRRPAVALLRTVPYMDTHDIIRFYTRAATNS